MVSEWEYAHHEEGVLFMTTSKGSQLARGASMAADVWQKLDQRVKARGGNDEDMYRLANKEGDGILDMVADHLVKVGAVQRNRYPVKTKHKSLQEAIDAVSMTPSTATSLPSISSSKAKPSLIRSSCPTIRIVLSRAMTWSKSWIRWVCGQPPCRSCALLGRNTPTFSASFHVWLSVPSLWTRMVAGTCRFSAAGSTSAGSA